MTPLVLSIAIAVLAASEPGRPQPAAPVTLESALAEARAANAQLPVSRQEVAIAEAQVREAGGARWPELGIGGHVHDGAPDPYTGGDARLQAELSAPIYDGGLVGSEVGAARARVRSARAGYRMAEKDLELEVTTRFSELLELEQEISLRGEGLTRLREYLDAVTAMARGGSGTPADVQRTQVRVQVEEAALADAEGVHTAASLEFNHLLGRSPDAPLALAALPPISPPPALPGETPWLESPDAVQAAADREAAARGVDATRAGRRPRLSLVADAGVLPTLGDSPAGSGLNNGEGWGGEVTLELSWPVWDGGVYRAQMDRAKLEVEQATQVETAAQRWSELQWQRARADLDHLYRQFQIRSDTVPQARDAYLQTESLYRGGEGTVLDVLDAFSTWVEARQAAAETEHRYRVALAARTRWGTP